MVHFYVHIFINNGEIWWPYCVHVPMQSLFQGLNLEPSLMRCCHIPCGSRPIDHSVNICNKLLLDIRRHIKKYYAVSICVPNF